MCRCPNNLRVSQHAVLLFLLRSLIVKCFPFELERDKFIGPESSSRQHRQHPNIPAVSTENNRLRVESWSELQRREIQFSVRNR